MKDTNKLARKFNKQATLYDKQRENRKFAPWRRRLMKDASGDILELAVGAGANFPYYPPEVQVTAVDISPKMLDFAQKAAREENVQANFILHDMETLEFPENSFDSIVSTLSFCGYDNPVRMFNQLNLWCKPGGTILLMEHGISMNPILAGAQKLLNPVNHKVIGCHLKRDILALVNESNLHVQRHEEYWKGIFHLIWANPK